MTAQPSLSIVIPTCNRPEMLSECLSRVAAAIQAAGSPPAEVIVSDDSADDRTRNYVALHHPGVHWVRGPRRGPAANRNVGVAAATGDWIVFTDDDCLPETGWIGAFVAALAVYPGFNVLEGKTVADRARVRLNEESPVNETGGYLWSCNMVIRRELFLRLGGFCESFPYAANEDVDLRLRLLEAGENFPFVDGAVVCHPLRDSKGIGFAVKAGKSYLHLVDRHPALLGSWPWVTFVLNSLRRLKQLLRDAARCQGRGLPHAVGCLGVALYFEAVARVRRRSQQPPGKQPATA